MRKKSLAFISLALVLCLAFLIGCGPSEPEEPEKTKAQDETNADVAPEGDDKLEGELTFWVYEEQYKDGENSPFRLYANQFQDENPGVTIEVIPISYGSSSYRDKYIQAANGGSGPDVMQCDNIWVPQLAAMELIIPLSDMLGDKVDEFFNGTVDAATYEEEVYGIPFTAGSMVLFYNKDMFREAGLDPEAPPATWDEFRDASLALKENGMDAFGLMGGWGGSFEWLPWFWQNGGEIVDENGKVAFNSEEGMEATKFFLNLLTVDKVIPEAALTWKSWDELTVGFANESFAMCQGMSVLSTGLERQGVDFEMGVSLLPGQKEEANTLGGSHLVINKNTKDQELAYAFLDFLTDKEQALDLCDQNGHIAARVDAEEQEIAKNDEVTQVFVKALETARPRPIIPEWTVIDYDCIQPAFMEVIFEGRDIDEAMAEAEVKAQAALDE